MTNNNKTNIIGLKFENTIPFIKMKTFSFLLSSLIIISGIIVFIIRGGFNVGIDFKGGVRIEFVVNKNISIKEIRNIFSSKKIPVDVNTVGNPAENHFMVTTPIISTSANEDVNKIIDTLNNIPGNDNYKILGQEIIEAKMGKTFLQNSLKLLFIVSFIIFIYVMIRFDFVYSISAIMALIHDPLIMLAFILFFNISIDIPIIAAILTIIGYSINDTIVVFDRIRELSALNKEENFEFIINKSITHTLSRTIITSLTTLLVALAIYFFGGIVLKNFALLLSIGVISGTYSSIFIAAPILYLIKQFISKYVKKEKK